MDNTVQTFFAKSAKVWTIFTFCFQNTIFLYKIGIILNRKSRNQKPEINISGW